MGLFTLKRTMCLLWRDPCHPAKVAESLKDPAGKPVPDEGTAKDNEEPLVAADPPATGGLGIGFRVVVECVKQSAVLFGLWVSNGEKNDLVPKLCSRHRMDSPPRWLGISFGQAKRETSATAPPGHSPCRAS